MSDAGRPTAPDSAPKYLADGIPKQDDATLRELQTWIDELLDHRQQEVAPDDLPDDAEPVENDADGKGIVVEERVKCGSDCTCNDGNGHGPYRYRYFYEDGSLTSEYVGKA